MHANVKFTCSLHISPLRVLALSINTLHLPSVTSFTRHCKIIGLSLRKLNYMIKVNLYTVISLIFINYEGRCGLCDVRLI
jgi:hypothetical protein